MRRIHVQCAAGNRQLCLVAETHAVLRYRTGFLQVDITRLLLRCEVDSTPYVEQFFGAPVVRLHVVMRKSTGHFRWILVYPQLTQTKVQ